MKKLHEENCASTKVFNSTAELEVQSWNIMIDNLIFVNINNYNKSVYLLQKWPPEFNSSSHFKLRIVYNTICKSIRKAGNRKENFTCTLKFSIERFSFECCKTKTKTKTKVITLANHKEHRQYSEPIKTRSNYMSLTQNAASNDTIGFGFTSDWMKKWRESFKPIT